MPKKPWSEAPSMSFHVARVSRLDREREDWLDITNFRVWEVLKLIEAGRTHIRLMHRNFKGSSRTLIHTVDRLVRWGLVSEDRMTERPFRRNLALTDRGRRMLKCLGLIGELVKEIRGDAARS